MILECIKARINSHGRHQREVAGKKSLVTIELADISANACEGTLIRVSCVCGMCPSTIFAVESNGLNQE